MQASGLAKLLLQHCYEGQPRESQISFLFSFKIMAYELKLSCNCEGALCSRHAAGAFPALPSVRWAALLSWLLSPADLLHHLSWSSFRARQKPPQAQSSYDTQHPVLVLQVLLFCFGCQLELKLSFPNEWQKRSLGPGVSVGIQRERRFGAVWSLIKANLRLHRCWKGGGPVSVPHHDAVPVQGEHWAARLGDLQKLSVAPQRLARESLPHLSYTESLRSLAS